MANKTACFGYLNGEKIELDNFRCFLVGFSVLLNEINFGYVCIAVLLVIILISIFGRIKENYRWLILNQAIWDLIISYRFICFNWIAFVYVGSGGSTCFYDITSGIFSNLLDFSIDTNSYSALLLLSFTRFLALYYPNLYQKLTQRRRLLYLIVIFNLVVIITTFGLIFDRLENQRKDMLTRQCEMPTTNATSCLTKYEDDFQFQFFLIMSQILYSITFAKPSICLLISVISAILIIVKIKKLDKIQNNSKTLNSNIRICAVISLQIVINIFVFIIETLQKLPLFLGTTFRMTNIFEIFILPSWLGHPYGLTDYGALQAIVQLRILVESLIVLFVMTGYRECILQACIWCFRKNSAIMADKNTAAFATPSSV